MVDLLKGYFKIGDRDDHRDMHPSCWAACWAWTGRLRSCCPHCWRFSTCRSTTSLAVPGPPQRRQRTLDAVKRLLLREGQVHPLLLVFEDLHWIDSLVDSLGLARLLLLVN